MPFLAIFTIAAWFGMNDLATSKASIKEQLPVLKRGHLWIMSLLYLATFWSGFSAAMTIVDFIIAVPMKPDENGNIWL